MIAATPRSSSEEARLNFSAAVIAMNPPRMTIAILMYSSGRIASCSHCAKPGNPLAITSPASSATM